MLQIFVTSSTHAFIHMHTYIHKHKAALCTISSYSTSSFLWVVLKYQKCLLSDETLKKIAKCSTLRGWP